MAVVLLSTLKASGNQSRILCVSYLASKTDSDFKIINNKPLNCWLNLAIIFFFEFIFFSFFAFIRQDRSRVRGATCSTGPRTKPLYVGYPLYYESLWAIFLFSQTSKTSIEVMIEIQRMLL